MVEKDRKLPGLRRLRYYTGAGHRANAAIFSLVMEFCSRHCLSQPRSNSSA